MYTEDVVVPRKKLLELLKRIGEVVDRYSLKIINFGHSGDGNVHVNIIKNVPEDVLKEKDPKAVEEIYRISLDLGSKIRIEISKLLKCKEVLYYQ